MSELFTALVHKNNEPNKVDLFGSFLLYLSNFSKDRDIYNAFFHLLLYVVFDKWFSSQRVSSNGEFALHLP